MEIKHNDGDDNGGYNADDKDDGCDIVDLYYDYDDDATSWRESLVGSSVQLPAHCVHHLRLPNLPAYIPIEYSVIHNTC